MKGWMGWLLLAATVQAGAIPQQITYQGTLKERGVPANGLKTMVFRLTNADGTRMYWSSGEMQVPVIQGLFAATLKPDGVDWQGDPAYVEISINGQTLEPREALRATPYALMSQGVVDGAIGTAKLSDGAVTLSKMDAAARLFLVPRGAILLFAGNCPPGWTHFGELDGYFPRGGAVYGATGGSATHTHGMTEPNATANGFVFFNRQGDGSGEAHWATNVHVHSITAGGNLPPYRDVVYCQKE